MSIEFRITRKLLNSIHADLSRRHEYAFERVSFVSCRLAATEKGGTVLLATNAWPIADSNYERDQSVGAMLGAGAFRTALQLAYQQEISVLHVHRHEHSGNPWFSDVDLREARRYVPDFWKVRPGYPHGILVLSHNSAAGLIWPPETRTPVQLSRIVVVGVPLKEIRSKCEMH